MAMKKYVLLLGITISSALSAGGTTGGFGVVAEEALRAQLDLFSTEYSNARDISEGKEPTRSLVDSRMEQLDSESLDAVASHYASAYWATNKMIGATTAKDFIAAKTEQTTAAEKAEAILSTVLEQKSGN